MIETSEKSTGRSESCGGLKRRALVGKVPKKKKKILIISLKDHYTTYLVILWCDTLKMDHKFGMLSIVILFSNFFHTNHVSLGWMVT